MKQTLCLSLLLSFILLLLTGCSVKTIENSAMISRGESQIDSSLEKTEFRTISVSNVDEFLTALNSNTVIELEDGAYFLNKAQSYGLDSDNPAYYWEKTDDGFQLVLNHLHDLTIRGSERELTSLMADSRYANILTLEGCKRIFLEKITLGHTTAGEMCTGGVADLDNCQNVSFQNVGFFGSGIRGLYIQDSKGIHIKSCAVYDCSISGLEALGTEDLQILHSDFYSLGTKDLSAMDVLTLTGCQNVLIDDCSFTENQVMQLLDLRCSDQVNFKDSDFHANTIIDCGFFFNQTHPQFDNCNFEGNDLRRWYGISSDLAEDSKGRPIEKDQLPSLVKAVPENLPAQQKVHVSSADEFLEAIGPNREIILDTPLMDLSTASSYGLSCSVYYGWEETYDGPQLLIYHVNNMTIRAEGDNITDHTLAAVPRYANVLTFYQCSDITLSGFTAGHTEIPGECTGGVLRFIECERVHVNHCGLFGCGILGISTEFCSSLKVTDCDIYECSFGGLDLLNTDNAVIEGNRFRDLGGPSVSAQDCENLQCDIPVNEWGILEPLY